MFQGEDVSGEMFQGGCDLHRINLIQYMAIIQGKKTEGGGGGGGETFIPQ